MPRAFCLRPNPLPSCASGDANRCIPAVLMTPQVNDLDYSTTRVAVFCRLVSRAGQRRSAQANAEVMAR